MGLFKKNEISETLIETIAEKVVKRISIEMTSSKETPKTTSNSISTKKSLENSSVDKLVTERSYTKHDADNVQYNDENPLIYAGILRQLDDVGRVVIPKEIREMLNWNTKDVIEIRTTVNGVYLKKYENACLNCGRSLDLVEIGGHRYCKGCLKQAALK